MSRKDIVELDFFEVVTFYKKTTESPALMKNHFYQSKIPEFFQAREKPTVACRLLFLNCLEFSSPDSDSTDRISKRKPKKKEVLYE